MSVRIGFPPKRKGSALNVLMQVACKRQSVAGVAHPDQRLVPTAGFGEILTAPGRVAGADDPGEAYDHPRQFRSAYLPLSLLSGLGQQARDEHVATALEGLHDLSPLRPSAAGEVKHGIRLDLGEHSGQAPGLVAVEHSITG